MTSMKWYVAGEKDGREVRQSTVCYSRHAVCALLPDLLGYCRIALGTRQRGQLRPLPSAGRLAQGVMAATVTLRQLFQAVR